MVTKNLILLLFFAGIIGCSENKDTIPKRKLHEKYFGIYIDQEPRQGGFYKSGTGSTCFYNSVKTIITNDTVVPIYIRLDFSEKKYETTPFSGKQFRLYLGDTTTTRLSKIIQPQEQYVINIGFSADSISQLGANMALFSEGHKPHFSAFPDNFFSFPDSVIGKTKSAKDYFDLSLAIRFDPIPSDSNRYYSIVSCGRVSFLTDKLEKHNH